MSCLYFVFLFSHISCHAPAREHGPGWTIMYIMYVPCLYYMTFLWNKRNYYNNKCWYTKGYWEGVVGEVRGSTEGNGNKNDIVYPIITLQHNNLRIMQPWRVLGPKLHKTLNRRKLRLFFTWVFSCVKVNGRIVLTRVFSFNQSFLR